MIVVEDTYDDSQLLAHVLTHAGVTTLKARTGAECLKLMEQHGDPTMIITDLAMPDMDGWQLLRQLRDDSTTAHIPIIAITAYYSSDVARDARSAGFDAFYSKPIKPAQFVDDLKRLMTV